MATEDGVDVAAKDAGATRAIDITEHLVRLAEDLKALSGSDLPLSCFIEQAKLKFAHTPETADAASYLAAKRQASTASDCFRAWAMPD
ncbi:hypothetical protein [Rhizobium sp. RAF56]|jgi:hypothetical protein|uniref:hypothetical protein n=1 Tax=Rhizobium sp. RAF56 TaxID=3233062 RepID=UPI003F98F2E3